MNEAINYQALPSDKLIRMLQEKDDQIKYLMFRLDKLNRKVYGKSSERAELIGQPMLFQVESISEPMPVKKTIVKEHDRESLVKNNENHHGRNPFSEHLEKVEKVVEPKGDLTGYKYIGDEITRRLHYIPGKVVELIIRRRKYVKISSQESDKAEIIIGDLPSTPIAKGIPTAMLLAWVMVEKFVYHIPFHRTIQKFAHLGVKLKASTVSGWMKQCCILMLLLYEKLMAQVLAQNYLMADETPITVLDRTKEGGTHLGYLWAYYSPLTKMVFFQYRSRESIWPRETLKNFKGHLQTDGYIAYKSLKKNNPNIISLNCMAHARRKFDEAATNNEELSNQAIAIFQRLYAVENEAREKGLTHEQRYELRQEKSVPILEELKTWMKATLVDQRLQLTDKSPIRIAIGYTLERWDNLKGYLMDGRLEIDNNLVENSIRPVALGKKNFLFAGSHEAAQNIAMLYSFTSTCRMQGKDPLPWLADALERLPDVKEEYLDSLLPNANTENLVQIKG